MILSFAQGLLDVAAAEAQRRPDLARRALRTAAGLPESAGAAWRALAKLHEDEGNLAAAREAWREVLIRQPEEPAAHAALARLLAADGRVEDALAHDARAVAGGAAADPAEHGWRLLRAGRTDEALAVLRAANQENPAVRAALAAARQTERPRTLRFPASESPAANQLAAPPPAPGGGRNGGEGARGGQGRNTPRPRNLPELGAGITLRATLKQLDDARIAAFRAELGLLPKDSAAAARRDLAAALADPGTLRMALRPMPAAARRLLRSLVKLGGLAPAAALFQTAGPEAPPPDYLQPLLDCGLLHLGADPRTGAMVAAAPADLLAPLAAALGPARSARQWPPA